jgi:hypothetical protein
VLALEEEGMETVTAEDAQVLVVVVRAVDTMVKSPGTGSATIKWSTMAHTSMVLSSTLTSGLIHQIMALGGIMNGDDEGASAAMAIEAGTAGFDRDTFISAIAHIGISSNHRHLVHSSTRGLRGCLVGKIFGEMIL